MTETMDTQTGEIIANRRKPGIVMPPNVAAAIITVGTKIKRLGQDDTNSFQKYGFVSIDKFMEVVGPIMAEAGIAFLMNEAFIEVQRGMSETNKEVSVLFCRWDIYIVHSSGEVAGPFPRSVIVQGGMAQAFGSAQSYIWKQFARSLFAIPTGDKDDPDLKTNETRPEGKGSPPVQGKPPVATPDTPKPSAAPTPQQANTEDILKSQYKSLRTEVQATTNLTALAEVELKYNSFIETLKTRAPEPHRSITTLIEQKRSSFVATLDGDDDMPSDDEFPV